MWLVTHGINRSVITIIARFLLVIRLYTYLPELVKSVLDQG